MFIGGFAVGLILSVGVIVYLVGVNPEPVSLKVGVRLNDVKIQPEQAIKLASPHLAKHGTYHWRKDRPMRIHIVRQKGWFSDWYFIRRHNYPAKTLRYNMNKAVKVHTQTGQVTWTQK